MIRLCYFADPQSSHTVKWVSYFCRHHEYEVHLMGWNRPVDAALAGVQYHHLPEVLHQPYSAIIRSALWHLNMWPVVAFRQMQTLLDRIRPDVLDILMINSAQIPLALARRGPLVITPWGHDLLVYPKKYRIVTRLALRCALNRAQLVLCNSGGLERAAVSLGARRNRIRRVSQVVDLDRFRPGLDSAAMRMRVGVAGRPVLLSPRLLLPNYRIEVMIQALPLISREFPGAQLVLLGKRDVDPRYASLLDEQIERAGVGNRVIFAGSLDNDAMPYALAMSDVVFSVPASDSRPSSVFEAMACGVPVVASDLNTLQEIIQPGVTGMLAPVGDPSALADATIRLLRDDHLRNGIIAEAREFVCREGDYEVEMARVASCYSELLRS